MISFVEWIQQWRFSKHEFADLAYAINHRWTNFPSRTDLDNFHFLRTWLENNGASEKMLDVFEKAWIIYEQEKHQTNNEIPGAKIRRVDISVAKQDDSPRSTQVNDGTEKIETKQVFHLRMSQKEKEALMSCIKLSYDYLDWVGFLGVADSRYNLSRQHLGSLKVKLNLIDRPDPSDSLQSSE